MDHSQSCVNVCMYFVQCSNMMWRDRGGGKGKGHYGNWERRAGGWGDATSTQCATIPITSASAPNLSITTWDKGKYNKWLDLDILLLNFVFFFSFFLVLCIVHV